MENEDPLIMIPNTESDDGMDHASEIEIQLKDTISVDFEEEPAPEEEQAVKAQEAAQNRAALQSKRPSQQKINLSRRTTWAHTSATSRSCASKLGVDFSAMQQALQAALEEEEIKPKKNVTFGRIHVHIHPLILGDNPGVSNGVPLQLDWQEQASESYDVSTVPVYDEDRYAGKFSSSERYRIALRKYSKNLIIKETKQVDKIKESRLKSQKDPATDDETFLQSRRKAAVQQQQRQRQQQQQQPKKLWWYHRR